MSKDLKIARVQDCLNWLQQIELQKWQSIASLNEFLWQLSVSMAFCGEQMAIAKQILNKRKVQAYHNTLASSVANQAFFAPSLAKDYIAAQCDQQQLDFDLCERCVRTLVHTIDAVRTAQSALKTEMSTTNYQS